MVFEGCCGQPARARARRRDRAERLPPNPTPKGGIAMIFLGSGRRDVRASASGLTYVVAGHRRHFRAHPDDVDALLRHRDFILRP
jgi:hypothetical protein